MAVVRGGKFMMRLVTFAVLTTKDEDNGYIGEPLDWEEARKRIFRGITAVEATTEEFKRINEMLRRIPVFKEFKIEEEGME